METDYQYQKRLNKKSREREIGKPDIIIIMNQIEGRYLKTYQADDDDDDDDSRLGAGSSRRPGKNRKP